MDPRLGDPFETDGIAHRWQPDQFLPDAAMSGRVRIDQLDTSERAWLVAVLTFKGVTTDDIAGKLDCSRRLIQQIRCEPMAAVTTALLRAQREPKKKIRREMERLTAGYVAEIERLKKVRDGLIDQLANTACRQGREFVMVVPDVKRPKPVRRAEVTIPLF